MSLSCCKSSGRSGSAPEQRLEINLEPAFETQAEAAQARVGLQKLQIGLPGPAFSFRWPANSSETLIFKPSRPVCRWCRRRTG